MPRGGPSQTGEGGSHFQQVFHISLGQRLRGQLLNKLRQTEIRIKNHEDYVSEEGRGQIHQSTKKCTGNFAVAS